MAKKKPLINSNLYVAYYRVSTDKQGERGLGMQAQQDSIAQFIVRKRGEQFGDVAELVDVWDSPRLFASYVEVETGTRKKKRPNLEHALKLCQKTGATLLIAKLDRLARNVHFISGLMESGVNFVALDFPEADKFTIHIMAAFAEREAEVIGKRTSEAIQMKLKDPNYRNAKGVRWGSPQSLNPKYKDLTQEEAAAARRKDAIDFAKKMYPTINFFLQSRKSLCKIAKELNRLQYPTASGRGSWTAQSVKGCMQWLTHEERRVLGAAARRPNPYDLSEREAFLKTNLERIEDPLVYNI